MDWVGRACYPPHLHYPTVGGQPVFLTLAIVTAATAAMHYPPLYFPATVGAKWVYQTGEVERVEVVTAVDQGEGRKVVTVARLGDGGAVEFLMYVRVSPRDLRGAHNLRCEPNTGWQPGPHVSFAQFTISHIILPAEEVTTPAGRFRAIPVQTWRSARGGSVEREKHWYALGVGLVKSDRQGTVTVLKSFSLGGN